MAPSSRTIGSRRSASRVATADTHAPKKSPFSFARNGPFGRVSLAAFVTRPQAEHQIGAVLGVCPQRPAGVNHLRIIHPADELRVDRRALRLPGALGRLRSGGHDLLSQI